MLQKDNGKEVEKIFSIHSLVILCQSRVKILQILIIVPLRIVPVLCKHVLRFKILDVDHSSVF